MHDRLSRGFVLGTAGHIDHGKSSLVRVLTGHDPDRLPEEKIRGMTIDLGFAALTLPSGRVVSIVDVPGHERFIANMVAGATGIDGALLVVAADEGIKPQTKEHANILRLLGVRECTVALSKIDLVDADWLAVADLEVRELCEANGLIVHDVAPVSALTGEGVEDLLSALDRLAQIPVSHGSGLPMLPIDRVFSVRGFGTVVTGTLAGGPLSVGATVEIGPDAQAATIRGMQSHGSPASEVHPANRVALNLRHPGFALHRGQVVGLPGLTSRVVRFDALVHLTDSSREGLRSGQEVVVLAGAAESIAAVFPLEAKSLAPGASAWVQIRLRKPMTLLRGQKFVLRVASPARTIGGGTVADISPRRRAREVSSHDLGRFLSTDPTAVITQVVNRHWKSSSQIALLANINPVTLESHLTRMVKDGKLEYMSGRYGTASALADLSGRVRSILATYHVAYPSRGYMPREELRGRARLERRLFDALLARLIDEGVIEEAGSPSDQTLPGRHAGGVALAEHAQGLAVGAGFDTPLSGAARDLVGILERARFSPPGFRELVRAHHLDAEAVRRMSETGILVRIDSDTYLARSTYDELLRSVRAGLQSEGGVTVAALRDRLGSSRKYVLVFLEHLDAVQVTRRVGDERVAGPRAFANRI